MAAPFFSLSHSFSSLSIDSGLQYAREWHQRRARFSFGLPKIQRLAGRQQKKDFRFFGGVPVFKILVSLLLRGCMTHSSALGQKGNEGTIRNRVARSEAYSHRLDLLRQRGRTDNSRRHTEKRQTIRAKSKQNERTVHRNSNQTDRQGRVLFYWIFVSVRTCCQKGEGWAFSDNVL